MGKLGDSLDQAVQKAFTRPAPKSAGAQMRYLVKQLKSTKAAAQALGISQRTVERYVKDQIKRPRKDLAGRLHGEVNKRWQPQVRAKAKKNAATTGGIIIETRARFGYTAAPGTTEESRVRHITQDLPPEYAARLFAAQEQGASEDTLQQIAAEALQERYFKDGGRRAAGLLVELKDVEYMKFNL
ncbi:telomere-protecting terminal protein Tpg [Streptomyces sp. NPDC059578]|uniref:telomere-protecting terminal protein Tpg n=1 Tax=Streptomyces sp. NPDC059578 TaxID=3346874 RepID=UPI0036A8CC87